VWSFYVLIVLVTIIFLSTRQQIGWKGYLQDDQLYIEWDEKSVSESISYSFIKISLVVGVAMRPLVKMFVLISSLFHRHVYAIQHIWCLSWEGCSRKGFWHKIGGWWRWGHRWTGWGGVQPDCRCLLKSRMMTDTHNTFQVWVGECLFWYWPTFLSSPML